MLVELRRTLLLGVLLATGCDGGAGADVGSASDAAARPGDGRAPDAVVPTPDSFAPAPDAVVSTPDSFVPAPDAVVSTPDAVVPAEDAFTPAPDAVVSTPDAVVSTPDALVSMPDVLVPPEDASTPAPDALPPDILAPDAFVPPPDLDADGDGALSGVDCDDADPGILGPTDWAALLPGLGAYAPLLPEVPAAPLDVAFAQPVPDLRTDRLAPAPWAGAMDPSTCDHLGGWPADRITVGPLSPLGDAPRCRVTADATAIGAYGDLVFLNRWPVNNIHVPANDVPGWVHARFPVPPGHTAEQLMYSVRWASLFGWPVTECHAAERDANGACAPLVEAPWQGDTPPGLFLLWSRPGGCGWRLTGPHAPAATPLYSGATRYAVSVPEALRTAPELDVVVLVYHQYPGGCAGENCVSGLGKATTLNLSDLSLETRAAFHPPQTPPQAHPRLYGDAATFDAHERLFDALPCPQPWHGADWGKVASMRDLWDEATVGVSRCRFGPTVDAANNRLLNQYLTPGQTWNLDRAVQTLYLLRRAQACLDRGDADCPLTPERLTALRDAYMDTEFARFGSWGWGNANLGFDLDTAATIRYWSLVVDTLWDFLTPERRARVYDTARPHVDAFRRSVQTHFWPTHNGNNWTPVLGAGALHWAIAFWHEAPDAAEVAREALEIQWLHRGFYADDGVYREGLLHYTDVSFSPSMQMDRLAETSLGLRLTAMDRSMWAETARWMLDFMAPDGRAVDFGDSWAVRGWGTTAPLLLSLGRDLDTVDPCMAREYFSNKWFDSGFRDPFVLLPALARDWEAIAATCDAPAREGLTVHLYPEGGWGGLRNRRTGTTAAAQDGGPTTRFPQADETFVAASAIPNAQPHTELDFGGLVWSAYGNRLLADFGYGDLLGTRYDRVAAPDQNPTGANTLVIEDALQNGDPDTNTSQISGRAGTVAAVDVGGTLALRYDGAAVYGRDDPVLGWLARFDRYLIPLPGGHMAVLDDFAVRDDRPAATVAEYWHTEIQDPVPAACDIHQTHVPVTLDAPEHITLTPRCHGLRRFTTAEVVGGITGASVAGGHFSAEAPVTYPQRVGADGLRSRTRYLPDAPVRADVRLFVLAAGVGAAPEVSVMPVPCPDRACFDVVTPDAATRVVLSPEGALRLE